ncbi:MAG: hypothetical protein QGG23_03580 [Candidatus Bathyarchaeota archaeon]|nr:hypothetical protein [Candidatus Bathyarchaeota archaeon]
MGGEPKACPERLEPLPRWAPICTTEKEIPSTLKTTYRTPAAIMEATMDLYVKKSMEHNSRLWIGEGLRHNITFYGLTRHNNH